MRRGPSIVSRAAHWVLRADVVEIHAQSARRDTDLLRRRLSAPDSRQGAKLLRAARLHACLLEEARERDLAGPRRDRTGPPTRPPKAAKRSASRGLVGASTRVGGTEKGYELPGDSNSLVRPIGECL